MTHISRNLRSLSLADNRIADFQGLEALTHFDCHGTKVTDLSPLGNCLELEWIRVSDLDKPATGLKTLSELPKLRKLLCAKAAKRSEIRWLKKQRPEVEVDDE